MFNLTATVYCLGSVNLFSMRSIHYYRSPCSIASFTVSADGALGHEATYYLKHVSEQNYMKWGKSHGEVMKWLQATVSSEQLIICMSPKLSHYWIWLMG